MFVIDDFDLGVIKRGLTDVLADMAVSKRWRQREVEKPIRNIKQWGHVATIWSSEFHSSETHRATVYPLENGRLALVPIKDNKEGGVREDIDAGIYFDPAKLPENQRGKSADLIDTDRFEGAPLIGEDKNWLRKTLREVRAAREIELREAAGRLNRFVIS